MVLASLGFVLFVFHLSKWGSHSLSVVYLKVAHFTRLASESQHKKLLSICHSVKNYNCVESTLKSFYQSSKDPEQLKQLALIQLRRKKEKESLKSYEMYFSQNFDNQSAYNYAKLLDQFGQQEKALEYYNKIITKKNVVAVSAVRNKIDLLIRMNRKNEAINTINKIKSMTSNHDDYMKQEIKIWENQVHKI